MSERGSLADAVAVISRSRASEAAARIEALGVRDAVLTFSTGVKLAMVARGYDGYMPTLHRPALQGTDLAAGGAFVALLVVTWMVPLP